MSGLIHDCENSKRQGDLVSAIVARRFVPPDSQAWDELVEGSLNGTFMHSRRFFSYHPSDKFNDHSVLFQDETGKMLAVFPAAEVELDGRRTLRSHPGASYGGIVFEPNLGADRVREIVESLVRYAVAQGFRSIWMRQTERVFHARHFEEAEAALFKARFSLIGRELSCATPTVNCRENESPPVFKSKARNAVQKAIRSGVTAHLSHDFAAYWQLLAENLQQHQVTPTHSLAEIIKLKELFPNRVELMGGYVNERLVAGTVIFFMNKTAAHTMYMAQDYEFQVQRPLNLVLANALAECARRGVPWLNYGISSIPGTRGLELNSGLYEFKRSCGGQGVVRDLFQKDLD